VVEEAGERWFAGAGWHLVEGGPHGFGVDEVELVRLVDGDFEFAVGQGGGQINQGGGRGSEGDALVDGSLVGPEVAPVDADALPRYPPARGDRDVDGMRALPNHSIELARRAMAQKCAIAAREYGGHELTVAAELRATHQVDPSPHAQQPTVRAAMGDRIVVDSSLDKLRTTHHPVLTSGK
jgi:hypothetical protein